MHTQENVGESGITKISNKCFGSW